MDNKLIYFEVTLHVLITIALFFLLIMIYILFYIIYSRYTLKKALKYNADLKKEIETGKVRLKVIEPHSEFEAQNVDLRKNNKDLKYKNRKLQDDVKNLQIKIDGFKARLDEVQAKVETNDDKDAIAFAKIIEKELKH